MEVMKQIGERIAALRKMKGYSKEAFCRKSGINSTTLNKVESGSNTTIEMLTKFANGLEVSIAALLPAENVKVVSADDFHALHGEYIELREKHEELLRKIRVIITE